jgi:hypothetical protein
MRKLAAALFTLVSLGLTGTAHARSLWDEGYVDSGWGYPAGSAYAPGYAYSSPYVDTLAYAYLGWSYPAYGYAQAPS